MTLPLHVDKCVAVEHFYPNKHHKTSAQHLKKAAVTGSVNGRHSELNEFPAETLL